jgi:peptide subunit release factor RF-3
VGRLQFDVVEARFLQEYAVKAVSSPLNYVCARWPRVTLAEAKLLRGVDGVGTLLATDHYERAVCLFQSTWDMRRLIDNNPTVQFDQTG